MPNSLIIRYLDALGSISSGAFDVLKVWHFLPGVEESPEAQIGFQCWEVLRGLCSRLSHFQQLGFSSRDVDPSSETYCGRFAGYVHHVLAYLGWDKGPHMLELHKPPSPVEAVLARTGVSHISCTLLLKASSSR